jgi:transcriptional regulator with XRE-family HTH domain
LGEQTPSKDRIKAISKILNCSINDLFSERRIAVLNMTGDTIVNESVIEDIKEDKDDIKVEVNADILRVSKKLNRFLDKNNVSLYSIASQLDLSTCTVWNIKNKTMKTYNDKAKKLEDYLDYMESESIAPIKELNKELNKELVEEPIVEVKRETPSIENQSICDKLNSIYDTLFNSLADLDELKESIAKLEKVNTLLKEIQGL